MDHIIQIKDFQGMTAKIEGSIGLFGVGVSGEIDVKNSENRKLETSRIDYMMAKKRMIAVLRRVFILMMIRGLDVYGDS